MKCPKCHVVSVGNMRQCNACGYRNEESSDADSKNNFKSPQPSKMPAGLRRTLSTEWVGEQSEMWSKEVLSALVEHKTIKPGETIICEGDLNRDLIFLTRGCVDISSESHDENLTLNEIQAPYLLGDIGFLSGFPRTATAKAKTQVEIFILCHEKLMALLTQNPDWMHPLLTSFSSCIKSLHFENIELRKKIAAMEAKNREPE